MERLGGFDDPAEEVEVEAAKSAPRSELMVALGAFVSLLKINWGASPSSSGAQSKRP